MKIQGIYAIEISGVCNLACPYCPYHLHERKRGLMDERTIDRIFSLTTTGEMLLPSTLHLQGIGEPLLHPEFEKLVEKIQGFLERDRRNVSLAVSTNALLLTEDRVKKLARIRWKYITLSPHKPEIIPCSMRLLMKHGISVNIHDGPDHNFAGKVENEVKWRYACEFSAMGKVVVRWNGDVALCCITDSGEGVIGNIHDKDIFDKEHRRFSLCDRCHLDYEEGRRVAERGLLVGDVARMHPVPIRQARAVAMRQGD